LSYRILFFDSSDFWEGCGKFTAGLLRNRRRWIWQRSEPLPPPEHFENEGWSSGIRFFLFVLVSVGSAYGVYHELSVEQMNTLPSPTLWGHPGLGC